MSQTNASDVVITGIGILSPIGIGTDAFWAGIGRGVPGFRRSEVLSYFAAPDSVGGEVSDFTEKDAKKQHLKLLKKSVRVMCRDIQLGAASAIQAMEHAGLPPGTMPADRVGVDFGANLMSSPPEVLFDGARKSLSEDGSRFDFSRWGTDGMPGVEPLWLLRYLPNMPGCHIGIAVDARGPNNSVTHDEASGGLVIAEASNIIRRGRADVMITGVTGTRLHPVKGSQATHWDPLASGPPETRVKPFDKNRKGEVLAEASCTLILENRAHAEARGATILGTILGCGASCVVDKTGKPNEQRAIAQAARVAMEHAGISVADIGHVNAGASGHPIRDIFEAKAIREILGEAADDIPVTAMKSYLGSAASGSSLCEIAASLLALQHGVIPKTLNYETPDPEAPLNVVHGEHLPTENRIFLKTNVTRVGQASAVVIGA